MPTGTPRPPRPAWLGFLLGAITGTLATVAAVLSSPGLYIDWGALPGILVVIPLCTLGAAALVAIPLAVGGWITRTGAAAALLTSLVVGESLFAMSQGTSFARWSAARHWAAVERRAAAEREETERDTCRRVLAVEPVPPPPAPPGAAVRPAAPAGNAPPAAGLTPYSRARCAELLRR